VVRAGIADIALQDGEQLTHMDRRFALLGIFEHLPVGGKIWVGQMHCLERMT